MSSREILRKIAWIAALAIVFFIFLWIGFAIQARRCYRAGERALGEGAEILAQGYFERSIRNHCPLNVWGKRAAERLEQMASDYEKRGNIERAIDAYEALMTALAAVDTGWSRSRREKIARLEKKVFELRKEASKPPTGP